MSWQMDFRSHLHSIFHKLHAFQDSLSGWAWPNICPACEGYLMNPDWVLCPTCYRQLDHPTGHELQQKEAALHQLQPNLSLGYALWIFDQGGTVQALQHQLKYHNRPKLGLRIGKLMGQHFLRVHAERPDLIVPIPLSRLRELERGYNQSAMLAQGFSEAAGIPFNLNLLIRSRKTTSQTKLNRDERWKNVRGAFELAHPEEAAGKTILLMDDVLTTGATLAAAAEPLLSLPETRVITASMALVR